MALFGAVGALVIAGVVASLADLAGDPQTRGFTRFVFGVVALRTFGLTLTGLASFGGDVWALIPL
jgi:hypothetical protein